MERAKEIQTEGLQDLRKHLLDLKAIRCPFFEEVLVAFCRAFPVRKMIPSNRMNANCVCTHDAFEDCALFREVMAKVEGLKPAVEPIEAKGVEGPATLTG
jgi:hypothetical protein